MKTASKSDRVRELLNLGAPAAEIAKKVGCTTGLVYNIKAKLSRGAGKRKVARIAKRSSPEARSIDYASFLTSMRAKERETEELKTTLEKIAQLIAAAL